MLNEKIKEKAKIFGMIMDRISFVSSLIRTLWKKSEK